MVAGHVPERHVWRVLVLPRFLRELGRGTFVHPGAGGDCSGEGLGLCDGGEPAEQSYLSHHGVQMPRDQHAIPAHGARRIQGGDFALFCSFYDSERHRGGR